MVRRELRYLGWLLFAIALGSANTTFASGLDSAAEQIYGSELEPTQAADMEQSSDAEIALTSVPVSASESTLEQGIPDNQYLGGSSSIGKQLEDAERIDRLSS